LSHTDDSPDRRWDIGYVPVALLIAAVALTQVPSPPCIVLGLGCLLIGSIVATFMCLIAKAQRRPISHATRFAVVMAVLFFASILLRVIL
jgi:hypothetical protein